MSVGAFVCSVVAFRVFGVLPGSRLRLRRKKGVAVGGHAVTEAAAEGEGGGEGVLGEPAPPDQRSPSAVRQFWGGEALDVVVVAVLLREVVVQVGKRSGRDKDRGKGGRRVRREMIQGAAGEVVAEDVPEALDVPKTSASGPRHVTPVEPRGVAQREGSELLPLPREEGSLLHTDVAEMEVVVRVEFRSSVTVSDFLGYLDAAGTDRDTAAACGWRGFRRTEAWTTKKVSKVAGTGHADYPAGDDTNDTPGGEEGDSLSVIDRGSDGEETTAVTAVGADAGASGSGYSSLSERWAGFMGSVARMSMWERAGHGSSKKTEAGNLPSGGALEKVEEEEQDSSGGQEGRGGRAQRLVTVVQASAAEYSVPVPSLAHVLAQTASTTPCHASYQRYLCLTSAHRDPAVRRVGTSVTSVSPWGRQIAGLPSVLRDAVVTRCTTEEQSVSPEVPGGKSFRTEIRTDVVPGKNGVGCIWTARVAVHFLPAGGVGLLRPIIRHQALRASHDLLRKKARVYADALGGRVADHADAEQRS